MLERLLLCFTSQKYSVMNSRGREKHLWTWSAWWECGSSKKKKELYGFSTVHCQGPVWWSVQADYPLNSRSLQVTEESIWLSDLWGHPAALWVWNNRISCNGWTDRMTEDERRPEIEGDTQSITSDLQSPRKCRTAGQVQQIEHGRRHEDM